MIQQLIELDHNICISLEKNTKMLFCDIPKDFDRLWYKGLFYEIERYGLEAILLKWIKHYLTDMRIWTVVRNSTTLELPNTAGVQQRSILENLLFIVYINDKADIFWGVFAHL